MSKLPSSMRITKKEAKERQERWLMNYCMAQVRDELLKAREVYPKFASQHEGWAVIKEEVDELWEEVRKKPIERDHRKMATEAKQIAAMAIRFMLDCTR